MLDETSLFQRSGAEALGTAFLVFIGVGSVPATLIVNGDAPFTMADLGMISLAFGTIVIATVYAFGHIGGNHINPAVTLGLAASGKFPWSQVPGYIGAQVVGAIVGAAAIIGVLGQKASDVGSRGCGVQRGHCEWAQAFTAEFVGTFILVFTIFGVIHRKAAAGFAGVAIGLVVFAAIIPVAPTTGASINPARTFGPMLVQQIAGGTVEWEPAARLPRRRMPGWRRRGLALRRPVAHPRRQRPRRCSRAPARTRPPGRECLTRDPATTSRRNRDEETDQRPERRRGRSTPGNRVSPSRAAGRPPTQDHLPGRCDRSRARSASSPAAARGTSRCTAASSASGMLDAACAGEVFTSPVPDQMLAATKLVDGGAGVLHIVKNYTGDVMNFEMAAELAAAETGAEVVSVVTDDDVAVQDSTWTAGRRGVGVTVLAGEDRGRGSRGGP